MKAVLLIIFLISFHSFADSQTKSSGKTKTAQKKSQRTTNARFSGTTVHGQYAHSPESDVTVEQEKKLISVVKPRETLKFQIKKSQEDYK